MENRGTITPKALSVMSLSLVDCAVAETADTLRKEDLEVLYDSYTDCIAICPGMYVQVHVRLAEDGLLLVCTLYPESYGI